MKNALRVVFKKSVAICSILGASSTIVSIAVVTLASSLNKSTSVSRPWFLATIWDKIDKTAICAVYAFVDATAISGPACKSNVWSASRDNVEPATLVIVNDLWPNLFVSTNTARLSAVSPDCEI